MAAQEVEGSHGRGLGGRIVALLEDALGLPGRGRDPAKVQVRRERDEALGGQAVAELFEELVQAPPGVQHQYAASLPASGRAR
jgi:hypothetical protein